MKHFFFCCLLASGSACAQSAITITAAQYTATAASVDRYQSATPAGVATPQTGANQTWDYRGITPTGSVFTNSYASVSGTPPFASSIRTRTYAGSFGPFSIQRTYYEGFITTGFATLGVVLPAQSFSLAATTGGPNDVFVIPAQTTALSDVQVPLPLTSTTRLARSSRVSTNGTLTAQILGYNQAPLRYVQRITTVDSVAGWGTVRIPVAGSAAGSAPIPVLLKRTRVVEQDSFYLNNQPAPPLILAAFGQTQGSLSYYFEQSYYRQNAAQPVMVFNYANSSFTTPTLVYYSAETAIPLATTAAREVATGGLTAWPNPAAAGQLLRFELAGVAAAQPLQLTLRDATGRVVASREVPNGQPATLPVLPVGLYLAEAEAANGARASRRVVVQ